MKVSRKPERNVVITLLAAFPFYSNPLKKRKALNQQHKNFAEKTNKAIGESLYNFLGKSIFKY